MKIKSAIQSIVLVITLSVLTACNDSAKTKKGEISGDTPATVKAEPGIHRDIDTTPPTTTNKPLATELLPATLCFENDGLKYALQIRIEYITTSRATVEVNSTDLGTNKKSTASFSCDIKDDQLLVKSISSLPPAGDASQWIPNKNWVIDVSKSKQTLLIPFQAKNYETNKWEEMKYFFDPCN